MIIKNINLKNFRNYKLQKIDFSEGINIIYGNNAQGKTNLLEAIYLLSIGKSQRSSKNEELILFNENETFINACISSNNFDYLIDIYIKKNQKKKGIAINKIPIKKINELLEISAVVYFSPDDIGIINDGPAVRRKWLDYELSLLDKAYLDYIQGYNKILKNRNALLTQKKSDDFFTNLDIWDQQLYNYGEKIIKKRKEFIFELNNIIAEINKNISGGKDSLQVEYNYNTDIDNFKEKLLLARDKDIIYHNTSVGPHRDDLLFKINSKELKSFGSQGQRKTAALALKLSEIEFIKNKKNELPVLLLDDVLSELDSNRQHYLLNNIKNMQTIITCTGLDEFIKNNYSYNKLFYCENGIITNKNN